MESLPAFAISGVAVALSHLLATIVAPKTQETKYDQVDDELPGDG